MNYFDDKEFLCKCGRLECDALTVVSPILLSQLNILRNLYGRPLTINSGLRCEFWNDKEGGVKDSEHLAGDAADIPCSNGKDRYELVRKAFEAGFERIGVGKTFVHLDVSPSKVAGVIWLYPSV